MSRAAGSSGAKAVPGSRGARLEFLEPESRHASASSSRGHRGRPRRRRAVAPQVACGVPGNHPGPPRLRAQSRANRRAWKRSWTQAPRLPDAQDDPAPGASRPQSRRPPQRRTSRPRCVPVHAEQAPSATATASGADNESNAEPRPPPPGPRLPTTRPAHPATTGPSSTSRPQGIGTRPGTPRASVSRSSRSREPTGPCRTRTRRHCSRGSITTPWPEQRLKAKPSSVGQRGTTSPIPCRPPPGKAP